MREADEKPTHAGPIEEGRAVLLAASACLKRVADSLQDEFLAAARAIHESRGKLVITGIGKAGHVATKVSATFASTGKDSVFLHPTEAVHGDLGRVTSDDVVLMLSNSGSTEELIRLVPPIRSIGARLIVLTSEPTRPLGKEADICIAFGSVEEAGHLGLAPTTSTSVLLGLGDALAMAVASMRSFSPAEFARFHPAGSLGRSLMRVGEVMRRGDWNPVACETDRWIDVVHRMSSTPGRPGAVSIVDAGGRLVGFYTDGDYRRHSLDALDRGKQDFLTLPISSFMTKTPRTIGPDRLVSEATRILRECKIDQVPVVDDEHRPIGLIDVQDLLDVKVLG